MTMVLHPSGMHRAGRTTIAKNAPITHPRLQDLLLFWSNECGDERLPPRTAFHFRSLRPWLGHIALVEAESSQTQFRYRLFGTRLSEMGGADHTGKLLDQAYDSSVVREILDPFLECVRLQSPVSTVRRCRSETGRVTLEQLLLPCSGKPATVEVIVGAIYLRPREIPDA
jgi:hypothetical protein